LSVERYIDVRETSRRYNDQVKLALVFGFIILLWIFAIVFPLPMSSSLFVFNRTRNALASDVSECRSNWSANQLSRYVQLKFACAFLLPSLITCAFSFRLIIFLHRWTMRSRRLSVSHRTLNVYKRRATTLVLLIIISFFLFWSPLWILQLYDTFNKRPTPYIQILNFLTLVFVYANGLLNPLLYLILTQNFRDYIRTTKWSRWKNKRQSRTNHQTLIYTATPVINGNQIREKVTSGTIQHDDDQHAFVT
jgi:hypothetical protein